MNQTVPVSSGKMSLFKKYYIPVKDVEHETSSDFNKNNDELSKLPLLNSVIKMKGRHFKEEIRTKNQETSFVRHSMPTAKPLNTVEVKEVHGSNIKPYLSSRYRNNDDLHSIRKENNTLGNIQREGETLHSSTYKPSIQGKRGSVFLKSSYDSIEKKTTGFKNQTISTKNVNISRDESKK